jgi:hypothetical protein
MVEFMLTAEGIVAAHAVALFHGAVTAVKRFQVHIVVKNSAYGTHGFTSFSKGIGIYYAATDFVRIRAVSPSASAARRLPENPSLAASPPKVMGQMQLQFHPPSQPQTGRWFSQKRPVELLLLSDGKTNRRRIRTGATAYCV